jgi:hypothetical protein
MRVSPKVFFLGSCLTVAAVGVISTAAHGEQHLASESSGFVSGLAVIQDLEPSRGLPMKAVEVPRKPTRKFEAMARPASPTEIPQVRASGASDVFTNTKSVLPLLVGDLEPHTVSYSAMRPMSGRSVGARPSLPWTKPMSSR